MQNMQNESGVIQRIGMRIKKARVPCKRRADCQSSAMGRDDSPTMIRLLTKTDQKHSVEAHICKESHKIGHEDLKEIRRLADLSLESICLSHCRVRLAKAKLEEFKNDPEKEDWLETPVEKEKKGSLISFQVLLDNGRRIHVEIDRHTKFLANAYEPIRNPKKYDTRPDGEKYAVLKQSTQRFHFVDDEGIGVMAKGTLRPPRGLVSELDEEGNLQGWKNPRTGSPHPDPFTKNGGSPSNGKNGGSKGGAGNDRGNGGGRGGDANNRGNGGGSTNRGADNGGNGASGGGGGGNNGDDEGGKGGGSSGGGKRSGGDGTTTKMGTNSRGEEVQMTSNRRNGVEEIHYKATKTTKDGTTTTKYENESRVDERFGHSKYFEVEPWLFLLLTHSASCHRVRAQEESKKGELFKTRRIGKGVLDKDGLVTAMTHCDKEIFEVRDEVKAALGQGLEAGVIMLYFFMLSVAAMGANKRER